MKKKTNNSIHSLAFDFDAVEMKMFSIIQKCCEKFQLCHFNSSNEFRFDVAWNGMSWMKIKEKKTTK